MRTHALSAAIALALGAATLAAEPAKPSVGPEALVAPGVGTQKTQFRPSAAFNGEVYLVAFQDGPGTIGNKACEIWCARLDRAGKPLDPKGRLACSAKGGEMRKRPIVSACGKTFLIAWEDYRNGKDQDIYAARVTGEGEVLDPDGFAVSAESGAQLEVDVASDGKTGWLLAWSDFRTGTDYDVYAARVSPEGRVLDPAGLAVATGFPVRPCQAGVCTTWSGKNYIVVWNAGSSSFACPVTPGGKVLDPQRGPKGAVRLLPNKGRPAVNWGMEDSNELQRGSIARGPERCLTVAKHAVGKSHYTAGNVSAVFLGHDGKPLRPANTEAAVNRLIGEAWVNPGWVMNTTKTSSRTQELWSPVVAPMGKDFLVVFQVRETGGRVARREDIMAARVLADGTCPDRGRGNGSHIPIDVTPGYNKAHPACCAGPEGEVLVVYERDKAVGDHKIAARVVARRRARVADPAGAGSTLRQR